MQHHSWLTFTGVSFHIYIESHYQRLSLCCRSSTAMSAPPGHVVSALAEQLSVSQDRDVRAVALKDLQVELKKLSAAATAAPANPNGTQAGSGSSGASLLSSSSSSSSPLDPPTEAKVLQTLIFLLLSTSSEVQELALASLTALSCLLSIAALSLLSTSLLSYIVDPSRPLPGQRASRYRGAEYEEEEEDKGQEVDKRRVAADTLTAVWGEVRGEERIRAAGEQAVRGIISETSKQQGKSSGVKGLENGTYLLDLLALLSAFLTYHAAAVPYLHADVLQLLLSLLSSASTARLRSVQSALAALAPVLSTPLFDQLMQTVTQRYGRGDATSYALISSLALSSSARLPRYLPTLVSLLLTSANSSLPSEPSASANDDREACLLAIDCLLRGCGRQLVAMGKASEVVDVVAKSLSYDPNWVQQEDDEDEHEEEENGMEDGMDEDMEGDEDGGGGFEAEDEYVEGMSDDEAVDEDDTSSKVRRAAIKCLHSLLTTIAAINTAASVSSSASSLSKPKQYLALHSTLQRLIEQLTPLLLSRFHERTDHILVDVLQGFLLLPPLCSSLRLSLSSMLPQPQLNKAIAAPLSANGKVKGKMTTAVMQLLASSYHALAILLASLPPQTVLGQLHRTLALLVSAMQRADVTTPAGESVQACGWELIESLWVQVGPAEWVSELGVVERLLASVVKGSGGGGGGVSVRVVTNCIAACEELIEMMSTVALMGEGGGTDEEISFLPMTLLDTACEVESEEERRKSWKVRGEDVLPRTRTYVAPSLAPKQVAAINQSSASLVPLLLSSVLAVLRMPSATRATKQSALNTLGLLFSHLPLLSSRARQPDLFPLLQQCADSPLTRIEAVRAFCRVMRCAALLPDNSNIDPALPAICSTVIGYLKQSDRVLQHCAMAALNTLVLRILAMSLHSQSADTSTVSAVTVMPQLAPLVSAVMPAFGSLHSLLALHADWMGELESVLTVLSHLVLLGMSSADAREETVRVVSSETLPALLALLKALPPTSLSYSLSVAIASVYSLYYFYQPPAPPLDQLFPSMVIPVFASSPSSSHSRALSMLVAASVLASTLKSVRGYSEVKAEIGWVAKRAEEDLIKEYISQFVLTAKAASSTHERLLALGVLGEIGRVHSLSPASYPGLPDTLVPVDGEALNVTGAEAFGLIVVGNPTDYFDQLVSLLSSGASEKSSGLALYSLHELLHHLAYHQVVALSHPFNPATVQPHSIPFPSSSLLQLIQSLSSSLATILPTLFDFASSAAPATSTLAVHSLTRLMALFPAPTLTAVQACLQQAADTNGVAQTVDDVQERRVAALLSALGTFVTVYLSSSSVSSLPSQAIDTHHRHNTELRPKILPPSTIFTAQLFSLLPFIIPLLSSPSLVLRLAAVQLLFAVSSHAAQLLTPHLPLLFASFATFSQRDARFVTQKQYGPLVKQVDEALACRVDGWLMLRTVMDSVEMNSRWYDEHSGQAAAVIAERETVVRTVRESLIHGLEDEAEVAVAVLAVVPPVVRTVPLTPSDVEAIADGIKQRLVSGVRADAVGAELQQHDEMCSVGVRVVDEVAALLDDDAVLVAVKSTESWRALEVAAKQREQQQSTSTTK